MAGTNSPLKFNSQDLPLLNPERVPEDNLHNFLMNHLKEQKNKAGNIFPGLHLQEDLLNQFLKENSN